MSTFVLIAVCGILAALTVPLIERTAKSPQSKNGGFEAGCFKAAVSLSVKIFLTPFQPLLKKWLFGRGWVPTVFSKIRFKSGYKLGNKAIKSLI